MGTTNETLQQSGKEDPFRHILKSSVIMHESSDSQFFKTTTGIQSGPDTFDESRLWFQVSSRGETGTQEIPKSSRLEFSGKFLAHNFALSDAEDLLQAIEYRKIYLC